MPNFCEICLKILSPPYIRCAECKLFEFCLECFAKGRESDLHLNCHDYTIIKMDFPLFKKSNWNFKEEFPLLDGLVSCGYGNWEAIARKVKTKSARECKHHYNLYYIDKNFGNLFNTNRSFNLPSIKYALNVKNTEEPPRYESNTHAYISLAGYNAARGDFEYEFDNGAETILSQLNPNVKFKNKHLQDLNISLQTAIIDSYNRRLRERFRRKQIIRNHGLIIARKNICSLRRYQSTIAKHKAEGMLRFMQITDGEQFDFIMEGLHYFGELKQYIANLYNLRAKGIQYLTGYQLYSKLLNRIGKYQKERKQYLTNCNWHSFINNQMNEKLTKPILTRRPPPPLQIVNLPGYEKLSDEEKELCSNARIVPQSYLEFKNILIKEYKRNGFLKLAQARSMIRIDVNKTRKIYDFLVEQGYITP